MRMYLSYSGFKKYQDCPRAYWHAYVNKTALPEPDNRVGMLYGAITGRLFELFYRDKLWSRGDPVRQLSARLEAVVAETMRRETKKGGTFNWHDVKLRRGPRSLDQVLESVRTAIPNGLSIIRRHKLLGVGAQAEVRLDSAIGGHMLAGRCDFLMRRISPPGDLVLLDGKGSQYRDRYVDPRQLHWYALLHRHAFGALPDRLGFVYWRSAPETAVDWLPASKEAVEELKADIFKTIGRIQAGQRAAVSFPAKARESVCRFCSYVPLCSEGQAMMSEDGPRVSTGCGVEDVSLD